MDKTTLRRTMRDMRDALSNIARAEYSARVAERLLAIVRNGGAQRICMYADIHNEVATGGVIAQLLREGRDVALPVAYAHGGMHAFRLDAPARLQLGRFGVMEPVNRELVLPEMFDLVVVPGVAFDRTGGRVGYGKGFYDRYLPACRCPVIGLAYPFQIVDEIELDPGDARMDVLLTPQETIRCKVRA